MLKMSHKRTEQVNAFESWKVWLWKLEEQTRPFCLFLLQKVSANYLQGKVSQTNEHEHRISVVAS